MTNKFINLTLLGALSSLCYVLNLCTKIWQCSLVFVSIALLAQGISYFFNVKKAIFQISAAIAGNIILHISSSYVLYKNMDALTITSLLSALISIYAMLAIFYRFNSKSINFAHVIYSLPSLFAASAIDSLFISAFFFVEKTIPVNKISFIFFKDIAFKGLYSILACFICYAMFIMLNKKLKIEAV
jgi:hypothetical protein